jgi:hypothetical protein
MDLEIVKRAICNAIPSNVNVSNVEMVEGNGKLSVKISWDVQKASEPEPVKLPSLNSPQSLWARPEWWTRDGYCRPLIDFDQHVPLDLIAGLPAAYREKMRAELEKSEQEANKIRAEKTELTSDSIRKAIDNLNAKSICEAEDARILEELAKKVQDSSKATLDDVREVLKPDGSVARRIRVPKCNLNEVAVKGTDQYEKALIRAGMDPLTAKEMAQDRQFVYSQPLPQIKQPKTTMEGKTVTPIDLPLPNKDPHVPFPATTEQVAEVRKKIGHHRFRRAEADDQATVIVNGKPKVIDGYQRPRFVKKADEVIAEFKKAVEKYEERYAKFRSPLAPKTNANDKGKRGVAALTTHSLPFSHKDRKVTDVEVMFLSDEKMAKLTEPCSLLDDLKAIEAKLPRQTKFKRILFHLKSIKNEILRK